MESVAKAEERRRRRIARVDSSFSIFLRIPLERDRAEKRIMDLAHEEPYEVVVVLLKHAAKGNRRVKAHAMRLLRKVVGERQGLRALVDATAHPKKDVRAHAVDLLREKRGIRAATYASFYQNVVLLISIARGKDVPVADIEALVETSKGSFVDGETFEALMDIGTSLDFIKHRLKAANMLKGYLSEVLRMAPDLSRMGVYDERIEEPLRMAIQASKGRYVDETSEIVGHRRLESSVRSNLDRLCKEAVSDIGSRPSMEPSQLSGQDVWTLSGLGAVVQDVTTLLVSGERWQALSRVDGFVREDAMPYVERSASRRKAGDQSAMLTSYTLALVGLRLASGVMPQAAEDIYQGCFRRFESEPSVHVVAWPELVFKTLGKYEE